MTVERYTLVYIVNYRLEHSECGVIVFLSWIREKAVQQADRVSVNRLYYYSRL